MADILIGTPICNEKDYCWEDWSAAIKKLKIPNDYERHVVVVDTTPSSMSINDKCAKEVYNYSNLDKSIKRPMDKVVAARNEIFKAAKACDAEYVLFVDSDVIIPPDTLIRLMAILEDKDQTEEGIASGFYPLTTRDGFPVPNAKLHTKVGWLQMPQESVDGSVHEVDLVGLGCCLIPRCIYERYLFYCVRDDGEMLKESEDMSFCQDIAADGFKIWLDTGLSCRHILSDSFQWDPDTA